jgi:hypothetical protein
MLGMERSAMAQPLTGKRADKTADELALEGRELAMKNDFQGAYASYLEAWKRKRSFDLAGNLGVVEMRLGKVRDAVEHLVYCEENFPAVRDSEQAGKLEMLRKLLKDARAQVGVARIRVMREDGASAEGASILVDGRDVGKVGAAGQVVQPFVATGDVYVDAGRRRFSARVAGCGEASSVMAVPKGGSVDARLVVSCAGARSWPLIATGFSIAAVQIGVGVGSLVYGLDKLDEFVRLHNEVSDGGRRPDACSVLNNSKCMALRAAGEAWETYGWIGGVGIGVGAAFAVGTGIWGFSGGSSTETSKKSARVSFTVAPARGGAVVQASF